jgi:hypothetical protein
MTFVKEVVNRLAPAEIIAGVILYILIRSIVWCLRQSLRLGDRAFKNETHRMIHRHVHDGHKGNYKKCLHPDCADIITSIISTI